MNYNCQPSRALGAPTVKLFVSPFVGRHDVGIAAVMAVCVFAVCEKLRDDRRTRRRRAEKELENRTKTIFGVRR